MIKPNKFALPDAKKIVAMIRSRLNSPLFIKKTIERLLDDGGIDNEEFMGRAIWEKVVGDLVACADAYLEPLSAIVNYQDCLFKSDTLIGTRK